jgi:hypothetical protein
MSLREKLQAVIRLEIGTSALGDAAVLGAPTGEKAWGSAQAVVDLLVAYCTGLETAVLRLADEVESLQLGSGEPEP